MTSRHVLIAGGGIGGLSAALGAAGQGQRITLFEQASEFTETGAGIQLSPNSTRVLFDLGLESGLRECAFLPQRSEIRDWKSGALITSVNLGEDIAATYGYPYLHVHRADLIAMLADAARASPRIEIRLGDGIHGYVQDEEGVSVHSGGHEHRGDALVGADGIHSSLRELIHGPAKPAFTGNVAWRAMIPADRLTPGEIEPVAGLWWGPGAHFVHYFVRRGEMLNCVCVVEAQGWEEESWVIPGDPDELRQVFSSWHPSIRRLIELMDRDTVHKWALFDREPMPVWRQGSVTLLGDACHPSLPFLAQGAAMAIEDSAVLARCLEMELPVAACLQHYEDCRRDRTAMVQRLSRRNAKVYHLSGFPAKLRNLVAGLAAGRTMTPLFGYDALTAHI